ncbi:MAG: hypothetical protein WA510_23685 [Acidobacteriaceae bacterium]
MAVKGQTETELEREEDLLRADNRWALIERILESEGFQRATQLRKILRYAAKAAILRPKDGLSEVEIACNVLDRPNDFDPATDNIVRAQFSHLRRKLDHYFDAQGKDEPLVLSIPRGNYIPVFSPAPLHAMAPPISEPGKGEPASATRQTQGPGFLPAQTERPGSWWKSWGTAAVVLLNVAFIVWAALVLRGQFARPKGPAAAPLNPFVHFLAQAEGNVTIVLPDTSLVMIQNVLGRDVSVADYVSGDFPQPQAASIKNPLMRHLIFDLGIYRTTSMTEAMSGVDFLQTLQPGGVSAHLRYARDLHAQDLSEGNSILIGGPNSNPWVSLFVDRTNFRHVDDLATHMHCFENLHPLSGEQARYENVYSGQSVGYVDVAFTQNPSHSGYILMINGADMQANDAATRLLLHGRLPPAISAELQRPDLHDFEFLLRGRHIAGEADYSVEVVAVR